MARLAEVERQRARFVDPTVLARIGKLDLLARTVVDGFINGLYRAVLRASITLWSTAPRAGRRHPARGSAPVRDRQRIIAIADTNTNFSILLDVSKSRFTSGGPSKLE
jgi:hypothetical protein